MTQFEQEQAAKKFVEIWKEKGNERSEAQKFWIQLLREVYGVKDSEQYIDFELPVKIKNTSFADGFIADTKVLIEMKGKDVDLTKPEKQSDGSMLTPFQQAKRYADELVYEKGVRWIIVSNFKEIHIYDMKKRHQEPEIVLLKELPKYYYVLQILVNDKDENIKKEEHISRRAGDIIGKIYDEVKPLYENPEDDETLQNLNRFCVRLVFCLYAEDAGLFGNRLMFHDYLKKYKAEDIREALIALFDVLNTEEEKRNPYLKEELKAFPYVNGGLFDGNVEIPRLNEEFKTLLLEKASENFDWTEISPTIFGGVFESTLNQETRRKGGMHYTTVENIRKVIKPLFLNELQYEFEKIKAEAVIKTKKNLLYKFQEKLASIKFLDPACGSGNFLTQTYLDLREIENNAIRELVKIDKKQFENQIQIGMHQANPVKVSINQFYGIEINDFAVSVAKTALWIAEHQMFEKTRAITYMKDEFLPLKTYTNIIEGNALKIDWNEVIPNNECNYIMGNPPFVGYKEKSDSQKKDLEDICLNLKGKTIKNVGSLDYVSGWYYKAASYMMNTTIKAALVSTNSITQGEQVSILWKTLLEEYKIIINFSYRTFQWDSEANLKAHVHCVIIGFSYMNCEKFIYDEGNNKKKCDYINPYLMDAPNVWIESRRKPLCDVKTITLGVHIFDDHNFIFSKDEKDEFIKREPLAEKYFKEWVSANDFLNGKCRYYLDLSNCEPEELRNMPMCIERIKLVQEYRSNNKSSKGTILEENIYLPKQGWKANCNYIAIPNTSSEKREYLPIKFMTPKTIITMPDLALPKGTLYDFGILSSNVHIAWVKVVCGRMKSDFRYANGIVYNNFPWPTPTKEQIEKIENTSKAIIEIREKYKTISLAELYSDKLKTVYVDLYKAHKNNDAAVMSAYGFNWRKMSEDDCVAELMKMYQKLVKEENH